MNTQLESPPFNGPQIMSRRDSESVVATPWEFIRTCEKRFGKIDRDLAASHYNTKAPSYFTEEQDALRQDWDVQQNPLNPIYPPFAKIAPWARKFRRSWLPRQVVVEGISLFVTYFATS